MPETENPQTQQPVERNPIQRKHMLPEKYVANYNEEGEITTDPSEFRQDKISVVNTAKEKPGGTTAAVDLMQSGANNAFNDFAKETKDTEEDKISVAHSLHRQAAAVTKEKRTGSMNKDAAVNQVALDQVKLKFTDGDKELWEQYCAFQLKDIKDVHCWISDLAWNNIKPIYKGWGRGSNFVGKRSEADSLINTIKSDVKLKTPRQRINKLESELGIPKDYWALKNKVEVEKIYRFYILEPKNLKIRMPEGTEAGAYLAEWVAGGRALGGGTEFVVDNLSPEDFDKALQLGGIEAWEIDFSTAECQATQMKSLPE